jgi:hypothetical protein
MGVHLVTRRSDQRRAREELLRAGQTVTQTDRFTFRQGGRSFYQKELFMMRTSAEDSAPAEQICQLLRKLLQKQNKFDNG